MKNRPVVNRVMISLVTALSFVAMSLSGIAAFIVPQGRIAYWTNWTFLNLSKTEWGNIHITTSVLFLIAGIWHTWYNWTPLMQYLRGVPGRASASLRDLAIAVLVTLFFTVGAVTKTPPLNYILSFNSWIKDSWVKTPADEPPFGHAELLSLKGFCKKMYIDTGEALLELRHAGIKVTDENVTLEQIARNNGVTPAKLYQYIKKLEKQDFATAAPPPPTAVHPLPRSAKAALSTSDQKSVAKPTETPELPRYTGDLVVERFDGKGVGKKTLTAICHELKLDCSGIKQKLAAKKMTLKDDETLKDAASRLGVTPIELLKAILVGEAM
ncbi:MAG: DUF4405 domain-containing protein [Deltaproteobacteria bacterium]|nr:DUF4405 domain-containing protein [Deltaproteobacteria bacterium]